MRTSLDKNKIKVLLLEGVHDSAVECFQLSQKDIDSQVHLTIMRQH